MILSPQCQPVLKEIMDFELFKLFPSNFVIIIIVIKTINFSMPGIIKPEQGSTVLKIETRNNKTGTGFNGSKNKIRKNKTWPKLI